MAGEKNSKYKKEYAEQAQKLCKKGFTDKELADFFGVTEQTINTWKKKHPAFLESLKSGKRFSDDLVEQALYDRAIGYTLEEVREEESEASGKKTVKTRRQVSGDTTAQIFWLKNRRPEQWRDKPAPSEEEEAQSLNISFGVNEPVGEIKVTRGE